MNATIHSEISAKRFGGPAKRYYRLHDFMDCSKEVEPTNKHRFLTHTMFFIKQVMIPLFGHNWVVGGKNVNIKDLLESDHILADYRGRFIPTLEDFSREIADGIENDIAIKVTQTHLKPLFDKRKKIENIMMAPLHLTGCKKALFATHNSWFVGKILPMLFPNIPELADYSCPIKPSFFFNKMNYKDWMQNGAKLPPSYELVQQQKDQRNNKKDIGKMVIDGSRFGFTHGGAVPTSNVPINPSAFSLILSDFRTEPSKSNRAAD